MFLTRKAQLVAPEEALAGRSERNFPLAEKHRVLDAPVVTDEIPEGYEVAFFGLGCFCFSRLLVIDWRGRFFCLDGCDRCMGQGFEFRQLCAV